MDANTDAGLFYCTLLLALCMLMGLVTAVLNFARAVLDWRDRRRREREANAFWSHRAEGRQ